MKTILSKVIPVGAIRSALVVLLLVLIAGVGGAVWGVRELSRDLPAPARIQNIEPPRKTLILAANGDTIHEFFVENRTVVPLSQIPRTLREAVVATEDRRFYGHYGLDLRRLVRVVYENVATDTKPGASTITQQLARNLFLTKDKKVTRKLKEMILALQLEQTYSKDEILEMYLNEIYLGKGAYGVQAAARTFFGKNVQDLNDAESTLIAGLIQLPETYSPFRHLDRAYKRREAVLASLVATGHIDRETARRIAATEVVVRSAEAAGEGPAPGFAAHYVEAVRREIEERYGYDGLYNDGLRITTTLRPDAQRWFEEALENHLAKMEREIGAEVTKAQYDTLKAHGEAPAEIPYLMGAGVLLDVRTGAVLAMVGGRDYEDSSWNLVTQAARQPGSIFKPIVYLTALKHGYMPCSILLDTPVVIDTGVSLWRPKNFNNRFMGPITLRYGLSRSKNVVTAKLINDFGVAPVLETARQLGVTSNLPAVHSLALGAGEVNLMEMVSAYAAFGNHGVRVDPYLITRVESADGEILEEARLHQREVLDPATAYLMADLMTTTLREGTAVAARWNGFTKTGAGKTGTYNEYTDAWFVGYTPSFAGGVWVGYDTKVSMGREGTGARMCVPIWAQVMGKVTADRPDEPFVRPEGIIEKLVCLRSGMLATADCDSTANEVFLAGNFPQSPCDLHGGPLHDFGSLNKGFEALDDDDEF